MRDLGTSDAVTLAPVAAGPGANASPATGVAVSVVIPTYNHAAFLGRAIRSALEQEWGEPEVVVVDDGSTDESRAVAAQYGDRVRYLWQHNQGLPAARNAGILASSGQLVAFLDADDEWLPGFLSAAVEAWRDDPDLGAVHTGMECIDGDGRLLPQACLATAGDEGMYQRLVDGEFFVPSSVVVRRECFDRVGLFDESLRGSEDWDMWLRVAREYRFAGVGRALVRYRVHGSNMSSDPDFMLRYQLMVVAKHFGEPVGSPGGWPPERQRAAAAVYRYAAQAYYLRGNREASRRYLRQALEANPSLSESVDVYYELGRADQPLGRRAAGAGSDLAGNAAFLLSALDELFGDANLPERLRGRRRSALGHACLALGLLAYENRRLDLARRFMARALAGGPRLTSQPRVWSTLAKSLLGRRLLDAARARAGRVRARRAA